jgi:hypothetical protein
MDSVRSNSAETFPVAAVKHQGGEASGTAISAVIIGCRIVGGVVDTEVGLNK